MSTIPTIESSENVKTGPVLGDARPGDFDIIHPEALASWSTAIDQEVHVLKKKQLQDDHFWAVTNVAQGRIQMSKQFNDMVDNIEPGDPNFADKVMASNQAIIKDQVSQAPTKRAAVILQQHYAEVLPHAEDRALAVQTAEGVRYRTQTTEDTFNSMFDTVRQNPSMLQEGTATLQAQLKAAEGRIPDSDYKMLQKKLDTLPSFALQGLALRDPTLALRAINEGAYQDVPQDQRDTLKQQLEPQVGLMAATDAQSQSRALRDAVTEVKATGKYSNGFDANAYASNFKKTGDAHYVNASEQLEQAAHFYDADSPMLYMNPVQMKDHIEKFRPEEDDPNYASKAKMYNDLVKSSRTRIKSVQGDPFAYSLNVPQIKVSYDVASNLSDQANKDPSKMPQAQAAMEKAISQSLEYQQNIGLPVNQTKILSKQAATSYATMIQKSSTDQLQSTVTGLQQKYGQYFPQMFRELQDLPKGQRIPPTMQLAIAHLGAPFESELLQSLRTPEKTLQATTGIAQAKATVDKAIMSNPLIQSFHDATAATSMDNLQYAKDITLGVKQFAYYRVAAGVPPEKAASDAASMLVGGLYDFGKQNGASYAISRHDAYGQSYNQTQIDTMKSNVDFLTHNLGTRLETGNIDPSNFVVDSKKPLPEEYLKSSIAAAVKSHGFWTTAPDNTGVRLNLRLNDGKSIPVMDKSGRYFGFSFDSLKNYSFADERAKFEKETPSALMPSATFMPAIAGSTAPGYTPSQ